jgi:hypothetical protein
MLLLMAVEMPQGEVLVGMGASLAPWEEMMNLQVLPIAETFTA